MNPHVAGQTIVDVDLVVDPASLEHLTAAVGSATAAQTAPLVPFFAATAAGQDSVVGPLELDLSRALRAVWPAGRPLAPLARRLLNLAGHKH